MSLITEMLKSEIVLVPAVVCFPRKGDKVLLMHRKKSSLGLGLGLISGIGGKVGDDPGCEHETLIEALHRECKEEIGITPETFTEMGNIKFIWSAKPKWNMDVTVYTVEKWTGEPVETHDAKPEWFDINQLPAKNMWEDNLHWLPLVLRGKKIQAVFLYDSNKKIVDYKVEQS